MRFASAAVLVTLCALVTACGPGESVEELVAARVHEMELLAEQGDRDGFMDRVAPDFQGQGGAMTREDFGAFMILQWNRYRRLEARLFPIEVNVLGEAVAQARFRALVTGGAGLIPEQGRLYRVTTTWVLDAGEWLLWRAEWEAVGERGD